MILHLTKLKKLALKLFVFLYGGKGSDTLSTLPYSRYMKMAASSSVLKFQKLLLRRQRVFITFVCITMFKNVTPYKKVVQNVDLVTFAKMFLMENFIFCAVSTGVKGLEEAY